MKRWPLTSKICLFILVIIIAYLSNVYIWSSDYYFPGNYEGAIVATLIAMLIAVPAFLVLIFSLISKRRSSKNDKDIKIKH